MYIVTKDLHEISLFLGFKRRFESWVLLMNMMSEKTSGNRKFFIITYKNLLFVLVLGIMIVIQSLSSILPNDHLLIII
jgi:hypothetical protein